jgi:uncharacterized protein
MHLTSDERRELLAIARTAVSEVLCQREFTISVSQIRGNLALQCGAFVTIRNQGQLRGCIGYVVSEKSLPETIAEVAVKAATQDPRFIPVGGDELNDITIEISVLSKIELLTDVGSIVIGVHGLYLEGEYHRGLLLPQVAIENAWDAENFITQVGRKAGITDFHLNHPDVNIYTFTADVFDEKSLGLRE